MLCSNYTHYREKSKDHKLTWLHSLWEKVTSLYENRVRGNLHCSARSHGTACLHSSLGGTLIYRMKVPQPQSLKNMAPSIFSIISYYTTFFFPHNPFGCLNSFCKYPRNIIHCLFQHLALGWWPRLSQKNSSVSSDGFVLCL